MNVMIGNDMKKIEEASMKYLEYSTIYVNKSDETDIYAQSSFT